MAAKKRTASGLRKDADPGSGANTTTVARHKPRERREKQSQQPSLTIEPRADWYGSGPPVLATDKDHLAPPATSVSNLFEHAMVLLEADNKAHAGSQATQTSAQKFTSTIMSAGTLEDKVSALTLLVQESPVHGMKAFENLLGLAKKKNRSQALMAVAAIKDLLGQGNVLPDRKLRPFGKQPGLATALADAKAPWTSGKPLPGAVSAAHLILWAFEDWLKKQYFEFLKALESWCSDEVEYARSRSITYVWELLKDKPEQEENLLRLLVNKLGDTDRKIASRTSYLLLQLQIHHPVMKRIIIDAIENECLFRPNQSSHAKYYSIITLNQTIIGKADKEVASELLRIYFSMFVQLLKPTEKNANGVIGPEKQQGGGGKAGKAARQKAKARERADAAEGELREKMTAQVLTGVNRAFPFADSESADFDERIDTIFRITHSSNFNTSIQALMLLQKLSTRKHHGVDRFYRTLYESLLDPRLITSSKQIMYLNLLYKSLKTDLNAKRVQAFVKRIFQIMNVHDVPFICGLLYLVSELASTFPAIRNMMKEPEPSAADEEERFIDVPDDSSAAPAPISHFDKTSIKHQDTYDPRKRDPEHSHADRSSIWDILPFITHFHPSVALFASSILQNARMPPKPDPTSHSLIHFLDRFIYRNAKSKTSAATSGSNSIMQPLASSAAADLLITSRGVGVNDMALNTDAFRARDVRDVPVDQVFFHSYFNAAKKPLTSKEVKKSKKRDADEDGEEGSGMDEDEDEDAIWDALVSSRPDIEGLSADEDDDLSMGDLESAMGSDSDEGDQGVQIADFPDEDDEDVGDAEDEDLPLTNREVGSDAEDMGFDDEDALLGDDDEIDLDMLDTLDEEDEEAGEEQAVAKKGKKGAKASAKDEAKTGRGSKKRKLKHLPTFASAEDYAKLLADEPDEDYS